MVGFTGKGQTISDACVIALGGHSLLEPSLPPTVENQFKATARAMGPIAELIQRGVRLVLTHGNGPQVGFMQLRSELASAAIHPVPLDSLVADSQGSLGFMLQKCLRRELASRGASAHQVVSIVTEVEVDPADPAFQNPEKPIGRAYSPEEAKSFAERFGWKLVNDPKRGIRRVVPSPDPKSILQLSVIQRLVSEGVTVIACGGGGIPEVSDAGPHRAIEAVIDKDRTSALLAAELGVERFIITTAVDAVYVDYFSEKPRALSTATHAELKELLDRGEFPAGSMGPKIEAAIDFLERGGKSVTICHPDQLLLAFDGKAGTTIS